MDDLHQWWEALFQIQEYATYATFAATLTRTEVDFLEQALHLDTHSTILDLACGGGRHLLELARRGYHVEGIELAMPVVEHVAQQIAAEQVNARILHRDMRDLAGLGPYDVAFIMNSSFGFWSDDEHQQLLHSIADVLVPGGLLLLQCINPYQIAAYMQNYRRGWHVVGAGYVLRESQFRPQQGCIHTVYRYLEPGGRVIEHPGERIRLYTYLELTTMLRRAGLQPISVFGDAVLPAMPFDEASQWQVVVARREL